MGERLAQLQQVATGATVIKRSLVKAHSLLIGDPANSIVGKVKDLAEMMVDMSER